MRANGVLEGAGAEAAVGEEAAQEFQQALYGRIFRGQPYRDYVRQYVQQTLGEEQAQRLCVSQPAELARAVFTRGMLLS